MMTQDTETQGGAIPPSQGKPRRALRALLIGSLTLNVVIVGVVGGAIFSLKRHDDPRAVGSRPTAPFVRALSFEDKREVGRAIRRGFQAAAVDRGADRERYEEALRLLRQTPFDEDALGHTLAGLDDASIQRRVIARESFLLQLVEMTDAERATYADRLEAELQRGRSGKHGKDKHGVRASEGGHMKSSDH